MLERIVISGGGTGGHIFPAIAIADEIKRRNPQCEILFIGAKGKMEMERVPKAGYDIVGLDIRGFQRKFTLKNFLLPFKIIGSYIKARKILKKFKPQVAIGVGGYASGPTLLVAQRLGIPTVLQEQNSYPGKTNIYLGKKADAICVAYENMDRFFEASKLELTGNPVRKSALPSTDDRKKAREEFGLDPNKPTILVVGGSLGARTLNEAILHSRQPLADSNVQLIWQHGKFYRERIQKALEEKPLPTALPLTFIDNMSAAYTAADLIISRAGALSISELCLVGKPAILVPSPNVAEDHQTKNAQALVDRKAVGLIRDSAAVEDLIPEALKLIADEQMCAQFSKNIKEMGISDAPERIVNRIEKLIDER